MKSIFSWILFLSIQLREDNVQAVVTDTHSGCNKIFTGVGGQILSPDFPLEYPDNLGCTWVIKTNTDSRIRIVFEEFQLEGGSDCFDRLIVNDGSQQDSPRLGKFCGYDGKGKSLTSSSNTMFLQFISDETLGEKGLKLVWEAIPKVSFNIPSENTFSDPWNGIAAPMNIIDFDAGFKLGSLWVLDSNYDIFYYDNQKWNVQAGKLESITVGASGIFGIHPTNKSIYWRSGAFVSNPEGYRWSLISKNAKGMRLLQSGSAGYIYGIGNDDKLYYAHIYNMERLDASWKPVIMNLENGGVVSGKVNSISCGILACWITMTSGSVYGMTTPYKPSEAIWTSGLGNYKYISSGFGDNVWAHNADGGVFKKQSVNSLRPMGASWKRQYGVNLIQLRSGLSGVWGMNKNGDIAMLKDAICGGFLFDKTGNIESPNYPSNYPASKSCLWVINPKEVNTIDLTFKEPLDIKKQPLCGDYLITTYPGIKEPIVECGQSILDKKIEAPQVLLEFVSNDEEEGVGFSIDYVAFQAATVTPTVTVTPTPVSSDWELIVPQRYFEVQGPIKKIMFVRSGGMFILTTTGRVFVRKDGLTTEILGREITSLAIRGDGVYGLDKYGNLVKWNYDSTGMQSWTNIKSATDYVDIYTGPQGMILARSSSGDLQYCLNTPDASLNCKPISLAQNIRWLASSRRGIWTIDLNGKGHFLQPQKKRDSKVYTFVTNPLNMYFKDIAVTNTGVVWAILRNNSLAYQNGISSVNPYGLKSQWVVLPQEGEKLLGGDDKIFLKTFDGSILQRKAIDISQSLPDGWRKLSTNIKTAYKVDAYPKNDKIHIWLISDDNKPYQGEYVSNKKIDFKQRGDIQLFDISIGESGLWAVDENYNARYFDPEAKEWKKIPFDENMWRSVESGSPQYTVYAINLLTDELYFRDGVSKNNVLGNKWVPTRVKVQQISSGPYITYAVMLDGQLRSFTVPPSESALKLWRSSMSITDITISNKMSVGFDGSLVYLTPGNSLMQRELIPFKSEEQDSKWQLNRLTISDVSAGPIIFAILQNDLVAKEVTSCFGFYDNILEQTTVQLVPGTDRNHCTWLATTTKTAFKVEVTKSNIPSSTECKDAGLFYSSDHQYPLFGDVKHHCGKEFLKQSIDGKRVFYQFYRPTQSFTDVLEMQISPTETSVHGCGGTFASTTGTIKSPNYPKNYKNKEACTWVVSVDENKKIELTLADVDIEFGGSLCDYDVLKVYDGSSNDDQTLGNFCGEIKNKVLLSTSNKLKIHFKSDQSGTDKGFLLRWKAVGVGKTTATPSTVSPTPFSACGGSLNSNKGLLASPNWPSNYDNNLYCVWYITTEVDTKIIFRLMEVNVEGNANSIYDYVELFDGVQQDAPSFGKYVGMHKDVFVKTNGNSLRVVFRSDASTNFKGFIGQWSVEKTAPEPTLPTTGWKKIYPSLEAVLISSSFDGKIWLVDKRQTIQAITKDEMPIASIGLPKVHYMSLGRNGGWVIDSQKNAGVVLEPSPADKANGIGYRIVTTKSPSGSINAKVISSLFNVYLLQEDFNVYVREGMNETNPVGQRWKYFTQGKDITENAFGVWVIQPNGDLSFFNQQEKSTVSLPKNGGSITKITSGLGTNFYAIINGELFKRKGLTFNNPAGESWVTTGIKNVVDVSINNRGVYIILSDNSIAKVEDTACGGVLQSKASYINYPEFDTGYKENQYCLWMIDIKSAKRIDFQQRRFDLEPSSDCQKDRVTIFGQGVGGPFQHVGCGSGFVTKTVSVESNRVFIEFISDDSGNRRGFTLSYEALDSIPEKTTSIPITALPTASDCGVTLTQSSGFVSSPNYPDNYNGNLNCEYKIRLNKGRRITLMFLKFEVESDDSCKFDSLKVYEIDDDGKRQLMMNLCGVRAVPEYRSTRNKLDLVFKSDSSTEYQGFRIKYSDTDLVGLTTVSTRNLYPSGWEEISTPKRTFLRLSAAAQNLSVWAIDLTGSPYYYDQKAKKWVDVEKPSQNLKLSVGNFGVYAVDKNKEFFFRYGVTPSNSAGSYWGRVVQNSRQLSGIVHGAHDEVIGVTTNDEIVARMGVTFSNPIGTSWKVLTSGYSQVSVGTYGYWLLNNVGSVYFATYVPSEDVYSKLNVVPINGKFRKVVAGFGGNVWAIDKDNIIYRRLNVNSLNPSGTRWQKIEFGGKDFTLFDISAGYDAVYGIASTGRIVRYSGTYCGGIYTTATGSFQSPAFPLFYPPNSNCLYVVKTPGFDQLSLKFRSFDIEKTPGCFKDYILISLDGKFPSKYAVEKDCGDEVESKIFKDQAWIEFNSNENVEKSGFLVEWKAEKLVKTTSSSTTKLTTTVATTSPSPDQKYYKKCGGSLSGDEGTIVHPNYPDNYENDRDCYYVITVAPDKNIQVELQEVNMESSETCNYDYLEVRDTFKSSVLRYCKSTAYPDFTSLGRQIVIRFYTDEVGRKGGFRLRWKAISSTRNDRTTTPEITTTRMTTKTITTITTKTTTTKRTDKSGCKKVFRSYSGYLFHPSYPSPYKNNINCLWTVRAPVTHKLSLTFQYFKLEYSLNCENDYVQIHDGPDENYPVIARFCGRDLPNKVQSTGNSISVAMKTNAKKTAGGVVILYKRVPKSEEVVTQPPKKECRFEISESSGQITHPGYPAKYAVDQNCYWYITVNENARIELQFVEFEIEHAGSCNYDFLRVIDGGGKEGEKLGQFCGNQLPETLRSKGNKMVIQFRSDDRQTRRGFKLQYQEIYDGATTTPVTTTPSRCVRYLSGRDGEVMSEGYPSNYPTSRNCHWFIEVEDGRQIYLNFLDMDIEKGPNCNYDFIRIYDGYPDSLSYPYKSNSAEVIEKYCGKVKPNAIRSSGRRLHIMFRSDDRMTRKGFKLSWQSVDKPKSTAKPTIIKPEKDCTYTLSGNSGFITHPNYPNNYRTDTTCFWIITVPQDKIIQLNFREFQIENAPSCYYDYLSVHDGNFATAKQIGKFCGDSLPPNQYSTENKMAIKFRSDDRQVRKGFRLSWKAVAKTDKECGGVYTTTQSTITHASYPGEYVGNEDCTYTINAPKDYRIVLYFQRFDIEQSPNCEKDYIEISEGADAQTRLVGKYCGVSPPSTVRSEKGVVTVRFKSDGDKERAGFKARYFFESIEKTTTTKTTTTTTTTTTAKTTTTTTEPPAAADQPFNSFHQLSGDNGVINHDGYPLQYRNNMDSIWKIISEPGSRIKLQFNRFSLQPSSSCQYDYVEIYDGDKKTENLIGRFCSGNPAVIRSSGPGLVVFFHSDDDIVSSGFLATWSKEDIEAQGYDICDPSKIQYNGESFKVVSPGFMTGQPYPPQKRCVLHLTTKTQNRFEIQIRDFDLQQRDANTGRCKDFLIIRDGDSKGRELGLFCGNSLEKKKILTSGSEVYLEFKSDSFDQRRGFHIHLETLKKPVTHSLYHESKQCGQILNGAGGEITNPTKSSSDPTTCLWIVNTPPYSQIKLTFSQFDLQADCNVAHIIIRDGGHSSSPIIGRYCGYKESLELRSTSNWLWIEYKSPKENNGKFVLQWSEINTQDFACGGTITGEEGHIKIPSYPTGYHAPVYCLWNIMVSPLLRIHLEIEDVQLGGDCETSYALVRDGMSSNGKQIGRYCSKQTTSLSSSGNSMWIEARSSCSKTKVFRAYWSVIKPGEIRKTGDDNEEKSPGVGTSGPVLGPDTINTVKTTQITAKTSKVVGPTANIDEAAGSFVITGRSGIIQSPLFPAKYPHDRVKVWILRGPAAGKIQLEFTDFDLEDDIACRYDFVEIKDGGDTRARTIARLCGHILPAIIESTSNGLWVRFESDSSSHGKGFMAKWTWVAENTGLVETYGKNKEESTCGGFFSTPSGQIESPSYPNTYPVNTKCTYIIKPTNGKTIRLEFMSFDLEDGDCQYDYVTIKAGSSKSSPRLARLCGSVLPSPITSDNGAFWIRFITDETTSRSGFSATWKVIDEES